MPRKSGWRWASFSVTDASQNRSQAHLRQTEHPNSLLISYCCPGQHKVGVKLFLKFVFLHSVTYDDIGQLKTARGKESGGTSRLHEQFGYAYDAAWNLNYRTNNALTQTYAVNNLN